MKINQNEFWNFYLSNFNRIFRNNLLYFINKFIWQFPIAYFYYTVFLFNLYLIMAINFIILHTNFEIPWLYLPPGYPYFNRSISDIFLSQHIFIYRQSISYEKTILLDTFFLTIAATPTLPFHTYYLLHQLQKQ